VVSWQYGEQAKASSRNDEEVISVKTDKLDGGYVLVYLYSPDFEDHLGKFESIKTAEYRLFESDTNVDFINSQLGTYHEGMFAINPDDLRAKPEEPDDDGNMPPPPEKLTSIVGCFLVYQNKQSVAVDHLNSACFERQSEESMLKHVIDNLKTTNVSGDLKGLQAFWSIKINQKRSLEGQKKQKESNLKPVMPN
jgi:hypothetical protein